MHPLDWLIGQFSPVSALKRTLARQELALRLVGGYEAGEHSRATADWRSSDQSPDTVLVDSLATLRARSREAARNNPHAAAIVSRLPAHIIGTGAMPRPIEGAARTRKRIADDWTYFAENCDSTGRASFEGMQDLVVRTVIESGEALVLWMIDDRDVRMPLRCRVLRPEFLDDSKNEELADGGTIFGGVQRDAAGRRVAYWLFDRSPTDAVGMSPRAPVSRRVDAEWVDHVFDPLWPDQVRGVPWLAPVALRMRGLDNYDVAEGWRKRMTSSLALIITNGNAPATSPIGVVSTQPNKGGQKFERFSAGTVARLAPGEDVKQVTPPPDTGYGDYVRTQLRAIAAGIGVPYAMLTGDLSDANYSSLREGKLGFWQLVDRWQWNMVHRQLLRPTWARFLQFRSMSDPRPGMRDMPVRWSFPKRPWVDPEKEANARRLEMQDGLLTWNDAVLAQGEDPQEQLAELADERKAMEAAGLTFAFQQVKAEPAQPGKQES